MKTSVSVARAVEKLGRYSEDELHPGILLALYFSKWLVDASSSHLHAEGWLGAHYVGHPEKVSGILDKCAWTSLTDSPSTQLPTAVSELFADVEKAYPQLEGWVEDLVGNADFVLRRTARGIAALAKAVEFLGGMDLFPEDADEADQVFQNFRRLVGRYFRSRQVGLSVPSPALCTLLVELANPCPEDTVFDPWASWGETLRLVAARQPQQEDDEESLSGIFGLTSNPAMARIAMLLALVSRAPQPELNEGLPDFSRASTCACDELRGAFDWVISAPTSSTPYSLQDTGAVENGGGADVVGTADGQAIRFALDLVHAQGAVVMALPPLSLNRGLQEHRLEWLKKDLIDAVITVPLGPLARYNVRSSIVVLRKNKPAARRHKVYFMTVPDVPSRNRFHAPTEDDIVRTVVENYRTYTSIRGLSESVDVPQILAAEGDLNPSRYTVALPHDDVPCLKALGREIASLEAARDQAISAFEDVLARLEWTPVG